MAAARSRRGQGLAFRLPEAVRPTRYQLELDVDPQVSDRYTGRVSIDVRVTRPQQLIELHAADLRIVNAHVDARPAEVVVRRDRETIQLVPSGRIGTGTLTLDIEFGGSLRSDLRGLYAASVGERKYAFTQLEAADARRFFPCFDEPVFKAQFALSVTTAAEHAVVSNSPIASTDKRPDGRKTVHFAQTPRLSTYLLALAVGDLVASRATTAGKTPIRVWHVPGNEGMTRFARNAARECLLRLEQYFGVRYPYGKLDLVAVPDFEFGAMENAGAVFFRETLLLIDESRISMAEKKRAAEVIAHELAHMWFGDLVTMAWWDDLWLNESFATWMAFHIVDQWKPEWHMWNDFGHYRDSAFSLDALDNTHPIYTEVRTPEEASENFDLITYEKGAAVVRMLERFLGAATFKKGVRRYIRTHREGNTVAADLWRALEDEAGDKVAPIARAWIEQPGFPLLRVKRITSKSGTSLALSQEPFSANGPAAKRPKDMPLWPVPFVARLPGRGKAASVRQLFKTRTARVPLGRVPGFVYGNADEGGFFRPLHDPALFDELLAGPERLTAAERLGLVSHQWALVRAGYVEIDTVLALIEALKTETDADVLSALVDPVRHIERGVASGPNARSAFRSWLRACFGPAQEQLGWKSRRREDERTRLRRAQLVELTAVVGHDARVVAEADAQLEAYLADRAALEPNLAEAVVSLGARGGDAARLTRYIELSQHEPTPQSRRRFRMALGDFSRTELVRQVNELCLGDLIPTQDVVRLLSRLLANPDAGIATWGFMKRRWKALERKMPSLLLSRLMEALPALGHAHRRDVEKFFAEHPVPTARRGLSQALERFDHDAALRARAAEPLERWLAARGHE